MDQFLKEVSREYDSANEFGRRELIPTLEPVAVQKIAALQAASSALCFYKDGQRIAEYDFAKHLFPTIEFPRGNIMASSSYYAHFNNAEEFEEIKMEETRAGALDKVLRAADRLVKVKIYCDPVASLFSEKGEVLVQDESPGYLKCLVLHITKVELLRYNTMESLNVEWTAADNKGESPALAIDSESRPGAISVKTSASGSVAAAPAIVAGGTLDIESGRATQKTIFQTPGEQQPALSKRSIDRSDYTFTERRLNDVYTEVRSRLGKVAKEQLKQEELNWLRQRDAKKNNMGAFVAFTQQRIRVLEDMLSATER